jgi:putative colanic acid biosynthesis acetyltransferase WcaB
MRHTFNFRADWKANKGNPKGRFITAYFRCAQWFALRKRQKLLWLLGMPVMVSYRLLVEWGLGCELPAKTRVGPGLIIFHGQGLVVNDNSVIGAHCILRHNTTIGNILRGNGVLSGCPVIGDRVELGANACVIGEILIGDDAKVGAGAVVVKNVPAGATALGNPARILVPEITIPESVAGKP